MQPLHMTIKPQKVHGRVRWRVTWRAEGKCLRKFFPTKAAAEAFAGVTKDEIRDYGSQFAALLAHERAAIIQAFRRAEKGSYSLNDACDLYESHSKKATATTVQELIDKCLVSKEAKGLKSESLRHLKLAFKEFKKLYSEHQASKITPADVAEFLNRDSWGQERRLRNLRDIRNLFNWGILSKLVVDNPANGVENPIIERKPIAIFTPKECRELLAAAAAKHKPCVPFVAVCLFGGLRPAEAMHLKWSAINTETGWIEVGASVAKTRSRRLVKMRDTLVRWLTRFPHDGELLTPKKVRKQLPKLRKDCSRWPKDVLRHSWVSYELAMSEDAAATALQAGHAEQIMFRHYRQLATKEQAREFWSLTPDKFGL